MVLHRDREYGSNVGADRADDAASAHPDAPPAPFCAHPRLPGDDLSGSGHGLRWSGNGQRPMVAAARHTLLLQVDGTPGTPPRGLAGIGVVVRGPWGQILTTRCLRAPAQTSNEAEYQALIAGLALMHHSYPTARVRCMSDSKVIVDQLNGRCAIRAPQLKPLYAQAKALVLQFAQIELVAIPRELNQLADALAWEALGGRRSLMRFGK